MLGKFCRRYAVAVDFIKFMAGRRLWLVPLLLGLLAMTVLVSLAQATHIAPFIYTLF
ncbi:MAG: DUF5989 family protein [Candidatus Bruticola sp.]